MSTDGISRATSPTGLRGGYFPDPYPIDASRAPGGAPLAAFAGKFDEFMVCRGAIAPGCFVPTSLSVTEGSALSAELRADGVAVHGTYNHNIFRMPDGEWEMAVSASVRRGSEHWTLGFNARPQSDAGTDGVPSHWVADSIIVGSPKQPARAGYDAKYLDADGQLYLIYSRRVAEGANGLAAQRMVSPSQPAGSAPVTLLAPSQSGGGLNSEAAVAAKPEHLRILETGNITKVGSVWVLVYSAGKYDRPDYKVGIAYANSPVPRGGYRKVLISNPRRVFGTSGDEVDYLLQSEEPDWPHYARSAVQAPGVGSIVHDGDAWYLFFAGYSPSEQLRPNDRFDADHRIPYFVKLHVAVPGDGAQALAHATGAQLSTWITPELGGRSAGG